MATQTRDAVALCSCVFSARTSSLSWRLQRQSLPAWPARDTPRPTPHFLCPDGRLCPHDDRHFRDLSSSPFHSAGRVVTWSPRPNLQSRVSPGPGMGGGESAGPGVLPLPVPLYAQCKCSDPEGITGPGANLPSSPPALVQPSLKLPDRSLGCAER